MSQFPNTESANNSYRKALEQYKADRERIKNILERMPYVQIGSDDIEWLCQKANEGINEKENNWYSHD